MNFECFYLVECALFSLAPPFVLACFCLAWKNLLVLLLPQVSQPSVNIFHSVPDELLSYYASAD